MAHLQAERHQPDYILLFTVVILCAVGVVTVYSASTYFALDSGLAPNHYAVRQLIASFLGLGLMFVAAQISYTVWYRWAPRFMFGVLMLLTLVLIPGIGISKLGGRRWLGHGSFTIQPSEFALIVLALYLAFFFSKQVAFSDDFRRGLLPALVVTGLNFGLVFLEPDMGTALTLLGVGLIVAIGSGARLKPLLIFIGAAFPVLLGLALGSHYRSSRITAFLHPFPETASTYQLLQGWTAITNGGLFGRGFGMSIEKTGYLPVPHIDFIFPVFVEEWGVVGAVALLAVFGVLIWRGFWIARHAKDRFGAVLAVGLTSIITVGTFINLGAVTGLLPVTGIPLPFISYGGTSLVISLLAMGMLLSVSRYTLDEMPESDELATVIEVSEARERLAARSGFATAKELSKQRGASVERLRKKRTSNKRPPTHGTWRASDEVAATRTKSSKGRTTRSTANSSAARGSWSSTRSSGKTSESSRSRSSSSQSGRTSDRNSTYRSTNQSSMTWRERNQRGQQVGRDKPGSKKSLFRRDR
ncbi:cell division protein FtsW [Alicyclobacillus sp. ALC3]|nr:cell division protein FtsW [Alicyclobacillus sp. ALC3]